MARLTTQPVQEVCKIVDMINPDMIKRRGTAMLTSFEGGEVTHAPLTQDDLVLYAGFLDFVAFKATGPLGELDIIMPEAAAMHNKRLLKITTLTASHLLAEIQRLRKELDAIAPREGADDPVLGWVKVESTDPGLPDVETE